MNQMKKKKKMVHVYLDPSTVRHIDSLVRIGIFPSRSDAIRASIHDLLHAHPVRAEVKR